MKPKPITRQELLELVNSVDKSYNRTSIWIADINHPVFAKYITKEMKQLFNKVDNQMLSIPVMADKIKNGEHFVFSRYGDGEFDAMVGTPGKNCEAANCDNHEYFKEMGTALELVLIDWKINRLGNYYMGLHWSKRIGKETLDWLDSYGFDDTVKFANNSVFHNALVDRSIEMVYRALEGKKVILVGPKRLSQQAKIEIEEFIEVPETNSWLSHDKIVSNILDLELKDRIVLFCSGPPTAVFIDYVYSMTPDECTLIDFGSTLDPNIGVHSRSFHRKHKLK